MDDKHILGDGKNTMILEWAAPKDALPEEALNIPAPMVFFRYFLVHAPSHIDFKAQDSDFRVRLHVLP
jgi:hypothetical protein